MRGITEPQKNYIDILSSYESTKIEDKRDIDNFLSGLGKDEISQLTIREASDLIQILLQRPTEYVFICGLEGVFDKQEVNSFNVIGELEACLHECPKHIDPNNCPKWETRDS